MSRCLAAVLSLAVLAPLAAAQSVWVVDHAAGPGADFTTIQAAVDGAAEGDVVLVRDGEYPAGFAIDGKSLTLAADAGATVKLEGFRVRNLAASQSVAILGMDAGPGPSFSPGVEVARITDCAGPVLLQGVRFDGAVSVALGVLRPTVSISHCTAVTFEGGSITGRKNSALGDPTGTTAEALACTSSQVQLAHVAVPGAGGDNAFEQGVSFFGAQPGGTAVRLVDSRLVLLGAAVTGGPGGQGGFNSFTHSCTSGGPGGAAVAFADAQSDLLSRASSVAGGAGGTGGFNFEGGGFCSNGPASDPVTGRGSIVAVAGDANGLDIVPAVVRESAAGALTLQGAPGDVALLIIGGSQAQLWKPMFSGVLMPVPLNVIPIGVVPASGALTAPYLVPVLPAGVETVVAQLQAVIANGGPAFLGGAGALVILDGQF